MRSVKRILSIMSIFGIVFSFIPAGVYADETSDLILKLLVKKGVISQKEVDELRAEVKNVEGKTKEEKKAAKDVLNASWKEGLRFETEDKKFDIHVGGRIYTDAAWMKSESNLKARAGKLKDDAEFRAARLETSGTVYGNFIYKIQMDFVGGDADFKDVYLGYKGIPYLGTFKAGHFKEPFSLEELTSSRFTTFMERALPNAFAPGRNIGLGLNSNLFDERITWATGVFLNADDFGDATSNEYSLSARITALPWYEDKGEKLAHVGASYSIRYPEQNLQYRQRPEAHLAPYFVDTGSFASNYANLLGLESAIVFGPLSLQGEFMQSLVDQTGGPSDTYMEGFYGQASYFLTGEHKNYKKSAGAFDRVRPLNNFSIKNWTLGAWEIAGRYSYIDLKDNAVNGGVMNDATVGLNWYLNPSMRIIWNYIHSHRIGWGDADILQTRFQVDF